MAFNFTGFSIGKNLTLISQDKILDKKSGAVLSVKSVLPHLSASMQVVEDVQVKKEIEVVVGVDGKTIELALKTSKGNIPNSGFLIEVYDSGSNGVLTRVYQEDIVDVDSGDTVSEGFSNYLVLKLE